MGWSSHVIKVTVYTAKQITGPLWESIAAKQIIGPLWGKPLMTATWIPCTICRVCLHVITSSWNAQFKTTVITLMSKWARWRLKSPASRLFTQVFIQVQIKENIKAPRHWPLCGNSPVTGEFPTQRASDANNISIWWCHRGRYMKRGSLNGCSLCTHD